MVFSGARLAGLYVGMVAVYFTTRYIHLTQQKKGGAK